MSLAQGKKNFSCILSKSSRFPNPHISLPYNNIGLTVLLNNSICKSIVKFRDLVFLNRVNSALLACSAKYFLLQRNDPLRGRIIPKYLYSFTISISLFSKKKCKFSFGRPLPNMTILVFQTLTFMQFSSFAVSLEDIQSMLQMSCVFAKDNGIIGIK